MNATPEDCEIMKMMASSSFLITTLFFCNFCCVLAIPLLVYCAWRIWNTKLMHFNTRLLLCFHLFWILVHVIGRSILHTTDLIMYLKPFDNGCRILHTRVECFYLRLPYNISLIIANLSAIFVSVERFIATTNTKNYEYGYKNVGFCLMFFQVMTGSILLSVVYSQTKIDSAILYYCHTTSRSNFMWSIYPLCALLVMQLLAVFIFKVAIKKNECRSAVSADLSSRYQNEENLWTIKLLKVYVYTNVTFTATLIMAVIVLIYNNHIFSSPTYYALIEGSSLQYLYALVLPMVLWYHRKNVQNQIQSAVGRSAGMDYVKVFGALRNQWEGQKLPPVNGAYLPRITAFQKVK